MNSTWENVYQIDTWKPARVDVDFMFYFTGLPKIIQTIDK